MSNGNLRNLWRSTLLAAVIGGAFMGFMGSAFAADTLADLRASEIRLRNTIEQQPADGKLRVQLAKVYLRLGNNNAAIAELTVAQQLRTKDEIVAPLLAQAMAESGDYANMLRDIPEGNRTAKAESIVRTYRALAQVGIGETSNGLASLQAAERLDPANVTAKLTMARLLLGQKQLQAATKEIDETLKIMPQNSAALDLKGLTREFSGDLTGAMGWFSGSIASNPRNVQALLDRANLESNRNQLDSAEKDVAAAKAIAPNMAMSVYLDAVLKAKRGRYQDADAALDKIRPMMQSVPDAFFLAGEIKFRLDQPGQAEDYLDKFIAQRQDQPQAYELLGVIAMQRGDVDRGLAMLEKAQALAPQDPTVAVFLAQAYLAHGQAEKAVALIDKTNAQHPKNPRIESERALAHFAIGDSSGNVGELSNLVKNGSGDLSAAPSLILAQMRAGKVDDAAKTAQDIVQREPTNILYRELLGAALVAQRSYPAAEAVFNEILAKQPSVTAARRSLAEIYILTHRPDMAVKLFQDWIAKKPNDLKAKEVLAGIYFQLKDDASAQKLLADAQTGSGNDATPGLELVAVYEKQRKWPDAIAAARALQSKFPNNLAVMDTLGRIYSESGDAKNGVAIYASATTAFPQSPNLWSNYATALAASKDYPAALDAISKAHALAPTSVPVERSLIYLTYMTKGASAALAAGQSFAGNTPQNPVGTLLTAMIFADNGKAADAIMLLQSNQAKSPNASVVVLLAKYLSVSNRAPEAIAQLEAWAKAHPNDYPPRFALAQLYGASGNLPMALSQFEWLASQHPNDPVTLNNLAWLYSQKNDPRARGTAQKAYDLAPQSGSVADTLGWIIAGQGDAAGSLKYLQFAASEVPDDQSTQYHLAYVLAKLNQQANARPILQKILSSTANTGVKDSARQLLAKIGG